MAAPASPPARRVGAGRRDVRLALGVVLVVASVVVGSRVLASADDRVPVWSAASALAAGTTLAADDLVPTPVSVDDLEAYAATSQDLVGLRLSRDLGAGELVPRSALSAADAVDRRLVTVPVDPLHAPPTLARGELVDVYVSPRDGASVGDGVDVLPALVLARALVADPGSLDTSGAGDQLGVVLDVAAADADRAVAAARGGEVDLVRVGSAP
jgi:hypothetical protein